MKSLKLGKLPTGPGVYFFLGKGGEILYIGKAANLRVRLRSYFGVSGGEKKRRFLKEAKKIKLLPTHSEIEALLQEARLIKKFRPKYNVLWRDDKNYFFVGITKETFPRIFLTHQLKMARKKPKGADFTFIGPFVSGRSLRNTLRMLRQYFPYCTCRKPHARLCLSSQLKLCPGYCCQMGKEYSKKDVSAYRENIKTITWILTGKGSALSKNLKKEIGKSASRADFERANLLKQAFESLEKIFAHKGLIASVALVHERETTPSPETLGVLFETRPIERIEMFDSSMTSGVAAVGAMVSFVGGAPEKENWRLFHIRTASPTNDPGMLREVIGRRFSHPEWQLPDLILVDGGRGQLAAAREVLREKHMVIPVAAIKKGKMRKHDELLLQDPLRTIPFDELSESIALYLEKIRDETHRFAISFHRKSRRREALGRFTFLR